jgi:magnesium transporter
MARMAYLNELIGRKVRDHRGFILGKLADLLISSSERNGCPPVVALALRTDSKPDLLLLRWTGNEDLAGNKIILEQREINPYRPSGNEIYLRRDLLDKQVIDTENYRVARVNDLELGKIGEEYHLINLVIDGGGFLRRLGLGAVAERITAMFHRPLQRRAVAWGDLNFLPPNGIQVKLPREKFNELHPADIAELLENLGPRIGAQMLRQMEDEKIADTLEELKPDFQAEMLDAFPNERAADIVEEMQPDDAADMLQEFDEQRRTQLINLMEPEKRADIAELLEYPEDTAGGLMTTKYACLSPGSTVAEALQELRKSRAASEAEMIYYVYVLDVGEHLLGVVSLGDLVLAIPTISLNKIMHHKPIRVMVDASRGDVMEVMTRYNLLALPVVDAENRLQGIITADHLHEIIESENTEDMLRMAGSDAEEMEQRSPIRTAFLRLPWIMATMFIELGAGLVIHLYDATLARVLLLASFMPIISAISGNTGLQSATIVVRGIATNQVQLTRWRHALLRQVTMTLLLGSATGLTLGVIGALWYGKWTFGLVVTIGMFAAVNIAGVVGTIVPLLSKRLGFDPAITSGPFETAFQDVVGISIYLTLATLLIRYLVK